jgi:hypothetical protein
MSFAFHPLPHLFGGSKNDGFPDSIAMQTSLVKVHERECHPARANDTPGQFVICGQTDFTAMIATANLGANIGNLNAR